MNTLEKILVVDDETQFRWNLRVFLEDIGFEVLEASGGRQAIEVCREHRPHAILLDITMPDLDGFEVCRRLKGDPMTSETPVIFLSALMNTEDKVKAFSCGGVDYVTKPFHFEEIESRVRIQLELHRQRRQLKEQHEALQRMARLRSDLTHMMAHDMRGPLAGVIGTLEIVIADLPLQYGDLKAHLERALRGAHRVSSMITQMLDVGRLESGGMPLNRSLCNITELARRTAEATQVSPENRRITITGSDTIQAWCDPGIVGRVIENLLGNARKFTPREGSIEIRTERSGNHALIAVTDTGPGIALEHQRQLFDKFSQVPGDLQERGFGLGLTFCKLAVEAHQGEIGVESRPGKGSTFWFTLPIDAPPSQP